MSGCPLKHALLDSGFRRSDEWNGTLLRHSGERRNPGAFRMKGKCLYNYGLINNFQVERPVFQTFEPEITVAVGFNNERFPATSLSQGARGPDDHLFSTGSYTVPAMNFSAGSYSTPRFDLVLRFRFPDFPF